MLNFYKKMTRVGVSYYIGIPKKLANLLEPDKEYAVTINENDVKPLIKINDTSENIENVDLIQSKNI